MADANGKRASAAAAAPVCFATRTRKKNPSDNLPTVDRRAFIAEIQLQIKQLKGIITPLAIRTYGFRDYALPRQRNKKKCLNIK